MRQLSNLNKSEISTATSGTEGDAVFEESESSDYSTGNKYNSSGEEFL
jgi:hypothetical protein